MHSNLKLILTATALILFTSCGTEDDRELSESKFWTGAGPSRGHEDITRFGVDHANVKLQEMLGYAPLPSILSGVDAQFSNHPIVQGNYETDHPSSKMRDYAGVSASADWQYDPTLQHYHSLRGQRDGAWVGSRETCDKVSIAIQQGAVRGVQLLRQGDRDQGLYWLGHATHILQDSFSQAHARRSGPDGRVLGQFCTFGEKIEGVCYHELIEAADQVWHEGLSCITDPSNRSWDCLKGEAKQATEATSALLIAAGRLAFQDTTVDAAAGINDYLLNADAEGKGYFNCGSVPQLSFGIRDVKVAASDANPGNLCGSWASTGPDLNDGAGGKFLDLCFRKGDSETPVIGLAVVSGKGASCQVGWEKIDRDLNEGAGGDYIYLCVNRGQGKPLQNIKATSSSSKGNHCGDDWNWISTDLNKKDSGNYVHICYR